MLAHWLQRKDAMHNAKFAARERLRHMRIGTGYYLILLRQSRALLRNKWLWSPFPPAEEGFARVAPVRIAAG